MDNVHIVTLGCHHCQGEHLHEVTCAGRLLASSLCSNYGHRITKDLPGLPRALQLEPAKMEAELPVLIGSATGSAMMWSLSGSAEPSWHALLGLLRR
jgi:hypothetical protein